ncbi:hypothetical protein [Phaeodactylibacter xiamenensis]|uniref:hypothetical protein n=1 Tax=Phaeodactylibacter xiamenensis TaxID=1524460 RepID=UPI003CCC2C81
MAFNDDFCGLQSSVEFTPITTGTYLVQMNEYDCASNSTCMTLRATLLSATCNEDEVVVDMSDSFGDGWNGNELEIINDNGDVVATATITGGASGTETFCLPDGCYTVDVGGGSFTSEVSWDISVNGNVALSGGAPESGLELEINSSCAPPTPENTSCANAEPATLGVNETETVNVGDGAENGCSFPVSSGSADHARWFTFTPAQSGEYTIGSSGFTIADTRLSIYTGNCGSLSCFDSSDDVNGLADQA